MPRSTHVYPGVLVAGLVIALLLAASRAAEPEAPPALAAINTARGEFRQKQRAAAELLQAAHAALDRGAYDLAIRTHQEARQAQTAAAAARQRYDAAVQVYLAPRLKDLDSDTFATREQANTDILRLGPGAVPMLRELAPAPAPGRSAEARERLEQIIKALGDATEDERGRLHQWACDATASSEYGNPSWSAKQATGKPDTFAAGDIATAWATKDPDAGAEWLELVYATPVRPALVRIAETYNPGAVVKLEAQDTAGQWHTLWTGKDTTTACPGWLELKVDPPAWACQVIKVHLDTALVPGWNEIDAVELVGEAE